jgi:hypothetical protein
VSDLDRAAAAAALGEASPEKVQSAFFLMSASLDGFLQAVPGKYRRPPPPPPAPPAAAAPAAAAPDGPPAAPL